MVKRGQQPAPIALNWKAVENVPDAFHLGTTASYWRKKGLWWAMRKVGTGAETKIETKKFRGPGPAKAWAEEFALEAAEKKMELRVRKLAAKQAARDAEIEARKRLTWGRMPVGGRQLGKDQIWAMKSRALRANQVLIVEIRKTTVVVLTRKGEEPWDKAPRDVRMSTGLTRLYRYVGQLGEPAGQGEDLPEVPIQAVAQELEPAFAPRGRRGRAQVDRRPMEMAPWLFPDGDSVACADTHPTSPRRDLMPESRVLGTAEKPCSQCGGLKVLATPLHVGDGPGGTVPCPYCK